jgi:hypothetical protein
MGTLRDGDARTGHQVPHQALAAQSGQFAHEGIAWHCSCQRFSQLKRGVECGAGAAEVKRRAARIAAARQRQATPSIEPFVGWLTSMRPQLGRGKRGKFLTAAVDHMLTKQRTPMLVLTGNPQATFGRPN